MTESILLKPNLVRKAEVDQAVMTHPAVMGAAARIFSEAGFKDIRCGDSCGIGTTKRVMAGSGMDTALESTAFLSGTLTEALKLILKTAFGQNILFCRMKSLRQMR